MIYGVVIFFAGLILKLIIDFRRWLAAKPVRHKIGAAIALFFIITASWVAGCKYLPLFGFAWWCLFDIAFGILIGEGPLYIGQTSWLDKLQRRYHFLTIVKYLMLLASLILSILI